MGQDPGSFAVDATLCDSAVVADGKLYVHGGGWNMLSAAQVPFIHARIGIAAVITVPYPQTNREHEFSVHLIDQDGQQIPIGPGRHDLDGTTAREPAIKGRFAVGRPPWLISGDSQLLPLAINIDQMEISTVGRFSFDLAIDDEVHNRLSFRVQLPR